MNEALKLLLDGQIERERMAGALIVWNGAIFPCCGGPSRTSRNLGPGGLQLDAQVTLQIRLSEFPDGIGPLTQQVITYTSTPGAPPRRLRVDSRTAHENATVLLECNDPAQAA